MKVKLLQKQKFFRFRRFAHKTYSVFNSMHKVVSIGVVTSCMLTFSPTTVSAQSQTEHQEQEKISEQELEEVTVTASRVSLPVNQTARLVTVISKQEIEQSSVQSIQDLLNYAANVDVVQRGSHGVQADISLRGGSFDQTAILLNGINLSSPHTGHYSFDIPINLSDIERIEIIHGPSSFIYGASAFSGGINIITKKRPDSRAYTKFTAGGHNLYGIEARGGINRENLVSQLSAGYNTSGGYIKNSDYDISNLFWNTGILLEDSKLDIQLGYNDKKYGANTFYTPAYPDQYEKTNTYLAAVSGETGKVFKFIPKVYWTRHNDCFQLIRGDNSKIPYNYHRSDVYGANLNIQYSSLLGITGFGSEFRNENILSTVLGKLIEYPEGKYTHSDSRTNISFALEHNILIKKITFSLGLLANYNTALPDNYKFYPALNASYRLSDNFKIYGSWNKANRMPTFTDLYYNTATHSGNPALKPEKSEALEAGFNIFNRFLRASVSMFYLEGKDLIDWINEHPENPESKWQSVNAAKVYKKGMEINSTVWLDELTSIFRPNTTLHVGYTRINQDGRNSSSEGNSIYILNYLRDKFTARLQLPACKNISLNSNFRWQKRMGKYTDYQSGEVKKFSPFSTLDIGINWKVHNLTFNLTANNIYNTRYFDLGNVPQAGFWMNGSISYIIN